MELIWRRQATSYLLHNGSVGGKACSVTWQSMSGKGRSPGSNLDKVQPTFATQYKGPLVLSPHS